MNTYNDVNVLSRCYIFFSCCFVVVAFQSSQFQGSSRLLRSKIQAKRNANQNAKVKKKDQKKQNALESCLEASVEANKQVLLVVDANNVRGKQDFKMTNSELLCKLKSWRKSFFPSVEIICAIDHGCQPAIYSYDGLGLVEFAGPNRTADDVIAQSARWFSNSTKNEFQLYDEDNKDLNIFIVTSDGGLRARCLQENKPANFKRKRPLKENVKVFSSFQLLASFEQIIDTNDQRSEMQIALEGKIFEVELDLRKYESCRPPFSNRQAKLDALAAGPWKSTILSSENDNLERFPLELPVAAFGEKTWHRIVVAENMRRMMEQLSISCKQSSTESDTLLSRYRSLHENSLSKMDISQTSMVFDRRIRFEPTLQKNLIEYLENSIVSISSDVVGESHLSSKAPVEVAADMLKKIVEESPGKTQDQILLRYLSEAPRTLQFPSKKDLRELLLFIGIREKRQGDSRPQWYLLPDHPSLDCWHVQPGETRRQKRRKAARQSTTGSEIYVDQCLLEDGKNAEREWFDLVAWPRQLRELFV